MAANTAPIFPLAGILPVIAVGDVTSISAGTGATTVVTAGSNGSKIRGIQFMPAALDLNTGGTLLVYYYDGSTSFLVGSISIPSPWSILKPLYWSNPAVDEIMKATHLFKVGKISQSGSVHAYAIGSDF